MKSICHLELKKTYFANFKAKLCIFNEKINSKKGAMLNNNVTEEFWKTI